MLTVVTFAAARGGSLHYRIVASGVLWALAYNAIWAIAWLAFMRTEWSDAAARAGSQLPWTAAVWLLWGAASAMIGIAIVVHASGMARPLSAALTASLVVWLPLTFGMTWWGVRQQFDARVLVLDAVVNLTAMLGASMTTAVLSLPMRRPVRQHDA